uniref:C2H2-type domain-containing protein n=1 Tax=Sphenodon punctatus TaxID=8508 RepID=A0A8D0H0Z8_SPHPU
SSQGRLEERRWRDKEQGGPRNQKGPESGSPGEAPSLVPTRWGHCENCRAMGPAAQGDWLIRTVKVEEEDYEEWAAGLKAGALLPGLPEGRLCKPEEEDGGGGRLGEFPGLALQQWQLLSEGKPLDCPECERPLPVLRGGPGEPGARPRPFACSQCGKAFGKKAHLTRHSRVHSGERPFACSRCGRRFSQKIHLGSHERVHTGERPFPCDRCPKRFRKKTHLVRHQHTHTGERPHACSLCAQSFADRQHLLRHQLLHQQATAGCGTRAELGQQSTAPCQAPEGTAPCWPPPEKPFSCSDCGKAFAWRKNLTSHRRLHAEGGRPFFCAECGRGFSDKRHLTAHLRGHMGLLPYACPHCDRSFAHRAGLAAHQRGGHAGQRPFACGECGRRFAHSRHLQRHRRTQHSAERPFCCAQCDRTFGSRASLLAHAKAHAGHRPFVCPLCGRAFGRKSHLARHEAVHTGLRPHACTQCPRRFSSKTNLVRHQAVHAGLRPYICTHCARSFSRKTHLLRHEHTHTSAAPGAQPHPLALTVRFIYFNLTNFITPPLLLQAARRSLHVKSIKPLKQHNKRERENRSPSPLPRQMPGGTARS